jgi:hypothetical protein
MKPKIYISHPRLPIEQVAKMVGVSRRRLKELMVIVNSPDGLEASRRSKLAGEASVNKRSKRPASR